ncbi:MAG: peptidyl-prolyl cis-trans isomerase [Ignavibacteriae bacterium]|nr:peptidyl-prolyl cis-trans isomerase [Ignavibacteriota bacterium]
MLTKRNNYILYSVLLLLLLSCSSEKKQKEIIVAEVGNSRLTKNQLNQMLEVNYSSTENKEEIVRNWVETELLYQAADENNLLKENKFNEIIKQSEKKLAASYAIAKYLSSSREKISNTKLANYFKSHKDDYLLPVDSYILNFIRFSSEKDAIKFRSKVLLKDWKLATVEVGNNKNVKKKYVAKLVKVTEIQSKKMLRVLKELRIKETSIVIQTELSSFVVVQLIEKLKKNTVPKLKYIEEEVRTIYEAQMNKEKVRNYINKLTTQKNVKVY